MKYQNISLKQAANKVIRKMGGSGGIVILGRQGYIAMPFNTSDMFRGCINKKEGPNASMFKG